MSTRVRKTVKRQISKKISKKRAVRRKQPTKSHQTGGGLSPDDIQKFELFRNQEVKMWQILILDMLTDIPLIRPEMKLTYIITNDLFIPDPLSLSKRDYEAFSDLLVPPYILGSVQYGMHYILKDAELSELQQSVQEWTQKGLSSWNYLSRTQRFKLPKVRPVNKPFYDYATKLHALVGLAYVKPTI